MAREWTGNGLGNLGNKQQGPWLGLGGASREFLCASARRRNLACYVHKSPFAFVVLFGPGVFTPEITLSQAGDEWNS
jgi:hypothetical protein